MNDNEIATAIRELTGQVKELTEAVLAGNCHLKRIAFECRWIAEIKDTLELTGMDSKQ